MELYNAIPESIRFIEPLAKVTLTTKGHDTDESISGPLVWYSGEGYTAHYYLNIGESVDQAEPKGESPDGTLVRCTFEEAMKDCWNRRYKMKIEERLIWDGSALWTEQEILASVAAAAAPGNRDVFEKARRKIAASIETACRKFREIYGIVKSY